MKGRRILYAIVLTTLCITGVTAQSFKFGPKAGLNISNYTGDNVESDALVGFHLGGLLNFGLGNVFSIQPEVLFSTQGAKIKGGLEDYEFKTNYVSVPVMLKARTAGGFYIELGPQVAFKTGEKIGDQTISDFANDLDVAAGVGLGFQAGMGLGIGARYVQGLSKVGTISSINPRPDVKNSIIQVGLFWAIPVR
ncbi:MAG: porin family protein [Spirosomataceae bacterium]